MNMRLFVILTVAICLLGSAYPVAAESGLIGKGKAYMDARMWKDAIKVLNKVIDADPKNAEAHVLLGKCYSETGDSYQSNERYKSAIALSLANSGKVSRAFLLLTPEQIASSRKLFDDEIEKRPSLKKKVAGQLFDYGLAKLKEHEMVNASALFALAIGYDNDLTYRACDTYYQLGTKGDNEAAFYFPIGRGYCYNNGKRMEDMGERILRYAARTKGEARKNLKEKALLFLSEKRVNEVIPPPSWKTVFSQEYVGHGWDNYVSTVQQKKDLLNGDKIIITGSKFEIYNSGDWEKHQNRAVIPNNPDPSDTGSIGVKAEEGEKFKVEVQRLVE